MRSSLKLLYIGCMLAGSILASDAKSQGVSPFSVKDDVELSRFTDIVSSPDGSLVMVHTWRASFRDGKLHDEIRVYDTKTLRTFVNAPNADEQPAALWAIDEATVSTGENGPPVTDIRWLADQRGIAFLLRIDPYHRRLCFARMGSSVITQVSSTRDDVLAFSANDSSHYVFTVASHELEEEAKHELDKPSQVATGKMILDVIEPQQMAKYIQRGDLWAATGGAAAPVNNPSTGKPIFLYEDGSRNLALSPDGRTLVTIRPLKNVPQSWETRSTPHPGCRTPPRSARSSPVATPRWRR